MIRRKIALGIQVCCLSAFLFACTQASQEPSDSPANPASTSAPAPQPKSTLVTLQGQTMGTHYTVKVVAKNAAESARITGLQKRIDEALEQVNDEMSTYRPDSAISRFNRHRELTPFDTPRGFALVLKRATQIGALTGGAFDVSMGPLIDLWGFDKGDRRTDPPSDSAIKAMQKKMGMDKVHIDERGIRKENAAIEVNLSGIAKGYGVDVVHGILVAEKMDDFMVEIGGEVRVAGQNKSTNQPWKLGINVPDTQAAATDVFKVVILKDQALATSGTYRNFFESKGKRFSHILDPRTGRPVKHNLVSASIVAPDCTTADALATAALVMGEKNTVALLKNQPGVEGLFITQDEGGTFSVTATPAFPLAPRP
jgi:thiamine biosynthesis lipoprotein